MATSSAFTAYKQAERSEALPLLNPGPYNRVVQATAGFRAWCRREASGISATERERERPGWEAGASTLGDGRLDVGTHLPLLGKRYRYLNLLGEGTSGQVILAQDTLTSSSEAVAIKIMKRQFAYAGQKEVRTLRWLHQVAPHASVVPVRDVFMHATHVCIVLPLLRHTLLDLIIASAEWSTVLRVEHTRRLAATLMVTLADMHSHGLVHADLKPENILLSNLPTATGKGDSSVDLRVIDLGTSFSVTALDTANLSFEAQTLPYRAPEVAMQQRCGPPMDMWSAGCILAEMLLQEPLFPADSPSQLLVRIGEVLGEGGATRNQQRPEPAAARSSGSTLVPHQGQLRVWTETSPMVRLSLARVDASAADLVMKLLRTEPSERLTAVQALSHPFLAPLLPLRHAAQSSTAAAEHHSKPAEVPSEPSARLRSQSKQRSSVLRKPKAARQADRQVEAKIRLVSDCRVLESPGEAAAFAERDVAPRPPSATCQPVVEEAQAVTPPPPAAQPPKASQGEDGSLRQPASSNEDRGRQAGHGGAAEASGRDDTRRPEQTKPTPFAVKAPSNKRHKPQAPTAAKRRRKDAKIVDLEEDKGARDPIEAAPAVDADVAAEPPESRSQKQPSSGQNVPRRDESKGAEGPSQGSATPVAVTHSEGLVRGRMRLRESRTKPSSPWWMVQPSRGS